MNGGNRLLFRTINDLKSLLGHFLTQMLGAKHENLRTLRHGTSHHACGDNRRGDDLPWFDFQIEPFQLIRHHGLQSGRIVGGVFHRHARGLGLANILGGMFHRVLAAVNHTIKIKQRQLVCLAERMIRGLQHVGHAPHSLSSETSEDSSASSSAQ